MTRRSGIGLAGATTVFPVEFAAIVGIENGVTPVM